MRSPPCRASQLIVVTLPANGILAIPFPIAAARSVQLTGFAVYPGVDACVKLVTKVTFFEENAVFPILKLPPVS